MIPQYGNEIKIKDLIDYNSERDKTFLVREILESFPGGLVWNFDKWGNICPLPKEDELPLVYFKDDEYYIEIKNYDLNQTDNFIPMMVYCYSIFKFGTQHEAKGMLTNNIAYRDARDCLDAARWTCFAFKDELDKYYEAEDTFSLNLDNIIIDENGNGSVNPDIEIQLIPLEQLEKHLIQEVYRKDISSTSLKN